VPGKDADSRATELQHIGFLLSRTVISFPLTTGESTSVSVPATARRPAADRDGGWRATGTGGVAIWPHQVVSVLYDAIETATTSARLHRKRRRRPYRPSP